MNGLFFDETDLGTIRQRAADHDWAARALERLRCGVECQREALLTTGRPDDGRGLGTTLLHVAICGQFVEGWHREAAECLLRKADDPRPFVFKQTHELCLALDFLPDLDPALRERIHQTILLPLGEEYFAEHRGGSNHQTTRNLSLLFIGLLTGRNDFLERVTSDPERSFPYHIANSVHPDGMWYEQCMGSYHTGTLERFLRTRWVADRHGIDLGGDDVIRRMIDTLPAMALPGGVLPRIGDVSGEGRPTFDRAGLFELAYAMYRIPWVSWALGRLPRHDMWSLLVGSELGPPEMPEPRSTLFDSSGLCVLKHGEGDAYWNGRGSGATITFGPHGDWHGHAGKLGIEYVHDEAYLVRDHGNSSGYSNPIHRQWFMTTLAHSTVVLDQRNQAFTWTHDRAELERNETGVCHAHLFRDDVSACTVSADFAYPGATIRRTLFLTPDYLLDITECDSTDGNEHTYDWVMHTGGVIQTDLPFAHDALECFNKGEVPSPPDRKYSPGAMAPSSYDYIREIMSLDTPEDWHLDIMHAKWAADVWRVGDTAMRLRMRGEPGTHVFKGVCPAAARDVYDPVVLVRRRCRSTVFVALHTPGEHDFTLDCPTIADGTIVCRVGRDGENPDVLVKQNKPGPLEYGGAVFDDALGFAAGGRDRPQ